MAVKLTVEQVKVLVKHHAYAAYSIEEYRCDEEADKDVKLSDKEVLGKMREHIIAALDLIEYGI